jgi:anti-sigma B factor antagonist
MSNEPAPASLREIRLDETISHLALAGELDLRGSQAVELRLTALTAARKLPTVLDLSEVTFMASHAIGLLVSCSRALTQRGQILILVAPQPKVAEVFAKTRLHLVMPIVPSLDQALLLAAAP